MLLLTWLAGLARRRAGRLAGQVAGVALCVALLASLGSFFAASRSRMTRQAADAVPVDWQVRVDRVDPPRALATVEAAPGVANAATALYADTTGLSSRTGGAVQTTGPGVVLGLPADYAQAFPGEVRFLVGSHTGVLLAQQTAANLAAGVGSTITIGRPGGTPVDVRVEGVVDLPLADTLFQSIGASPGSAPTAPPDNVVILPSSQWERWFGSAPSGTSTQIHVRLSRALPSDPGAAFAEVVGRAHNLEATFAGAATIGDNLAAQLDAARSDAVYAQLLFLFLGIPGVVLTGLVTGVIASSSRERRRAEQALARVRGANARTTIGLAAVEAVSTGAIGILLGLAAADVIGRATFGSTSAGATASQALEWRIASVAVGMTLSLVTVVLPARRDARALSVRSARAVIGAPARPLALRLFLDVVCLAAGGGVFWQALRSGYQVVLAPEGVPTISVGYFTLLAPVLFWIGGALLIWRVGGAALSRARRAISGLARLTSAKLSDVVAASMARRRRSISRGVVLLALTGSFALSVAIFNTTYTAQARVDAELTNGADVTVTTSAASGLPDQLATAVAGLPGVAATQPMQHRFAYVGNDLQDLYGIEPSSIGRATTMSDAFFAGGSASSVLSTLAAHPDGVLVSDETVHDFQLQPGDLLRLRLQFASDHQYHIVPFTYVGIAREFPTAPRDSFLVANASYVAQQTGSSAAQTLLVRTTGSPPQVADAIRSVLGPASGASVQDIVTQQHITLSALTAIDLSGLTRLELGYALVLAVVSSGLVLALGLAERRRSFAILSALGGTARQLGAFVWSEALYLTIGGLVLGSIAGWGLAYVIVRILTGVFDPPPSRLTVPWPYLGAVGASTVVAVVVAGWASIAAASRPAIEELRDL